MCQVRNTTQKPPLPGHLLLETFGTTHIQLTMLSDNFLLGFLRGSKQRRLAGFQRPFGLVLSSPFAGGRLGAGWGLGAGDLCSRRFANAHTAISSTRRKYSEL